MVLWRSVWRNAGSYHPQEDSLGPHNYQYSMTDAFDHILEEIGKRLPDEDDKLLLKELIQILKDSGSDSLKKQVKKMLEAEGEVV